MSFLGNTPEKRKRSKLALLWGSSLIVCYLGFWFESTILLILSVILILTTAMMNIIVYRKQYYSSLKEIRGIFYKGLGKTLPETPYDEALKEMETNKKTRENIITPPTSQNTQGLINGFLDFWSCSFIMKLHILSI